MKRQTRRLSSGVVSLVAVVIAIAAWGCAKQAPSPGPQPPSGPPPGAREGAPPSGGAGGEGERARGRQQMVEQMIQLAQLNEQQTQAVKEALAEKDKARQALRDQLDNLRRTANQASPTDEELQKALQAYQAALAQYREKVQTIDAELVKQLPLAAQVRCASLGILENGLGPMGMRGGRESGAGRARQRPGRGAG